jgi:predicted nucleic acid-binding Zn ribbon protein
VSQIPMMQEIAPTGFTQRAIRPGMPAYMKHNRMQDRMNEQRAMEMEMQMAVPLEPASTYRRQARDDYDYDDDQVSCKQFSKHVDNCKSCYKLYKRNVRQSSLIIFLVFVIILLLIKLMDKHT